MSVDDSSARPKVDRETTTPFHLKLFYRQNSFHHLSDFPIPPAPNSSDHPARPLPPHVEIYTWQSCTLRELAHLLTTCLPMLLPDPAVGTRLSFRLIYPDTKSQAITPDGRGKYLSKDMGSVILGAANESERRDSTHSSSGQARAGFRLQGDDADKTLQDIRFIIGDYVECAILPPLADGSVAPPIHGRGSISSPPIGGRMRAFGDGPPGRQNGFGRPRGFGRPGPRGGGFAGGPDVPSGEWRRGERIPDNGRGYSRGPVRGGRGRPY